MSHEEVWDDSLLIQQYDAAMDQVKHKVSKQLQGSHTADFESNDSQQDAVTMQFSDGFSGDVSLSTQNNKKKRKKNKRKLEWQVGAACRCKYAEDGQMYEATITHLTTNSPYATVTFVGYGNSEQVPLVQLYRSKGNNARALQERDAATSIGEGESGVDEGTSSSSGARGGGMHASPSGPRLQHRHFPHMDMKDAPMLDLPPPPAGLGLPAGPDGEALHTMLLSWYMTGYHTGYYKGVTDAQHNPSHHSSHHHS